VKIKAVTIQGFRGFNEKRTIAFDDSLTLIYAPNSYGKTSISEAFEWLLYGETYKIATAESKDEFKGSYRNRHLPESMTPFAKVIFMDDKGREIEFCAELDEYEAIKRFVDGQEVENWSLAEDLSQVPRPFILQHALKHLLLARPDERFQRFAKLLGLEKLDLFHRNIISVCTKPDACMPSEASELLQNISMLERRLTNYPSLIKIKKALDKGIPGLKEAYEAIALEAKKRVPPETKDEAILSKLLQIREDAVGKIFKGSIILPHYTDTENLTNDEDENFFINCVANSFIQDYVEIAKLSTIQNIIERAEFLDLGLKLFDKTSKKCPFCGQSISDTLLSHIKNKHKDLANKKTHYEELENKRTKITGILRDLRSRIVTYNSRNIDKSMQLIAIQPTLANLESILLPKHQIHFKMIETTISQFHVATSKLEKSYKRVLDAIEKIESSIKELVENVELVKELGMALTEYISGMHQYVQIISERASAISDANRIVIHELDILAGTEDISVLIELIEQRKNIEKRFEIEKILDGLKDLRKSVDQYVANRVLQAISQELSLDVMQWYEQIKTTGDPDVHFNGFDMERTKKGEVKPRRVQVKAKSYGKDLVSAVSSLSESKLNALGLCVSIATNLKGESPFDFLIIDDPIQSWDAEHEIKFIDVIRKLVQYGKQVVLLSHNSKWMEMVCSGCRVLNGYFYEITGYTVTGPHFKRISWVRWKDRLDEVDAILKDPGATRLKLQQAEEEVRILNAELTSELYYKVKEIRKNPDNLNSTKVRKMLIECGVNSSLVDRITMTFETTDNAHHAPVDYATHRERIRNYHGWAHELASELG